MNNPIKLVEQPEPTVKSEVVSELRLTRDQLVSCIRQSAYGNLLPPDGRIEITPIFQCATFDSVKLVWKEPLGVTINMNGHTMTVTKEELSYEEVVALAFQSVERQVPDPLPMLTVTVHGTDQGGVKVHPRTLIRGQTIKVWAGMNFNAYDTSNA